MNPSIPASASESLLFSWEPPRREQLAIAASLVLSLILHGLCFYIFQIVYPPTISLLPPPARVSMISSNSEEGRTLLRWVEAEDPALAFTTQRPPEGRLRTLPKAEHVPSYLAVEPVLKQVPPLVPDLRIPSSQPPGAVQLYNRQISQSVAPKATSVLFSTELEALGSPALPSSSFTASSDATPEAIRFRVAVNGGGEIWYCLPLSSSGDPALDEQARRYLARCRFPRKSAGVERIDPSLTWGIATMEWGNDVTSQEKPAAPNAFQVSQ